MFAIVRSPKSEVRSQKSEDTSRFLYGSMFTMCMCYFLWRQHCVLSWSMTFYAYDFCMTENRCMIDQTKQNKDHSELRFCSDIRINRFIVPSIPFYWIDSINKCFPSVCKMPLFTFNWVSRNCLLKWSIWEVIYLSVRGIDIASVSTMFPIGIRNSSEGVVSFCYISS
jgi:hypothetical protein